VRVRALLARPVPVLQELQGSMAQEPQIRVRQARAPREQVQPARSFAARQF
jgi:hypothetical protein